MVWLLADDIELDEALFEVRRGGEVVPLEPQAFDVLVHLVRHRDRVVSKEELMDTVWGGRFVSETAVTSRIKQVRAALGDDGQAQRCVRTSHGRGYRFTAPVTERPDRRADGVGVAVPPRLEPSEEPRPPVRYTRSDGLHIAYQVTGGGPLDLVLISGFVSHLDLDWDDPRHAYFLDRLGQMGRLVRFDKRGTGMSDRPSGVPDLETRMHDVLAVMDAVGSERAVLCGYSEGGPMAMLMAATHPERVSGLVLYGSYAKRTRSEDYPWTQSAEELAAYTDWLVEEWDWEADLVRRCPSGDQAMRTWWSRRMRAAATPGTIRRLMEMNALVDVRAVLPRIGVPTLVLHRTGDAMFSWRGAQYLAEHIPDARLQLLAGEDHLVVGDARQLVDAIEPFVATVPRGPTAQALAAVTAVAGRDAGALADALVGRGGRWRTAAGGRPVVLFDGPATAVRAATAALPEVGDAAGGVAIAEVSVGAGPVAGPGVDAALALADQARPGQLLVSRVAALLLSGSGIAPVPVEGVEDACLVPAP